MEKSVTEMVKIINSHAIPAHPGVGAEKLKSIVHAINQDGYYDIVDDQEEESLTNPINELRTEVMEFVERNKEALLPQLGCDGKCHNHPDAQVVHCWLRMKGKIK